MKPRKSKKNTELTTLIEHIIGYVLSVGLAFFFALFCSWRIGFFLVLTFLFAPVLSVLLTLLFLRSITMESELSKSYVGKKENLELILTLNNRMVLPSPGIVLKTLPTPCSTYEQDSYEITLYPRSTVSLRIPVTANICGASKLGISDIRILDYLNLFSFHPKAFPKGSNAVVHPLSVVPDIEEISGDEDYIRQTYTLSTTCGESDETVEVNTNVMGSFPGYEHREYIPGDPIKRINWKLSAKRDKLYVRLDDEVASSSVLLVLDPASDITETDIRHLPPNLYTDASDFELPSLIQQNAVETSLGIAATLLSRNLSVTYMYYNENNWESYPLSNYAQITQLQQSLSSYSFQKEPATRFPFTELPENGAVFLCTTGRFTDIPYQGIMVYSSLDGKGRKL